MRHLLKFMDSLIIYIASGIGGCIVSGFLAVLTFCTAYPALYFVIILFIAALTIYLIVVGSALLFITIPLSILSVFVGMEWLDREDRS